MKARHHLGEMLLSVCQFAAARVVHSEERHDAVDYEQFKDTRLIVELNQFERRNKKYIIFIHHLVCRSNIHKIMRKRTLSYEGEFRHVKNAS